MTVMARKLAISPNKRLKGNMKERKETVRAHQKLLRKINAVDFGGATWSKGDSAVFNPICVEVAHKDGIVALRDSKYPSAQLRFTRQEWEAFVSGVNKGKFVF